MRERPITRPKDPDEQSACYSGKKKRHTVKNVLLAAANGTVPFLSDTYEGSRHDKPIADQTPYPFPLDLNANDSDGTPEHPWESNIVSGFVMLPVVITIQWQGVDGPRRFDLFSIITPISDSEAPTP